MHFTNLCGSTIDTAIKYKFKWVVGRGPIVLLGTVFCILFSVHFSDLHSSMFYTAIKYKFKQVVGRRLIVLLGTVFCILFTSLVYIFQTYVNMWLNDLDCRKIQVQAGSWQRTYCTSFSVLGAVFCTSFSVNFSVRISSMQTAIKYKFKQVVVRGLISIILFLCTVFCVSFTVHFSDLRGSKHSQPLLPVPGRNSCKRTLYRGSDKFNLCTMPKRLLQ